jgi:hypothetical protein
MKRIKLLLSIILLSSLMGGVLASIISNRGFGNLYCTTIQGGECARNVDSILIRFTTTTATNPASFTFGYCEKTSVGTNPHCETVEINTKVTVLQ